MYDAAIAIGETIGCLDTEITLKIKLLGSSNWDRDAVLSSADASC